MANTESVFPVPPATCALPWDRRLAAGVVVEFVHQSNSREGPDPAPETPLPLSLKGKDLYEDPAHFGPGSQASLDVTVGGDSAYGLVVWFGEAASAEDRAAAARVVSSIAFPYGPLLKVPEELRKRVIARGIAWGPQDRMPWSLVLYRNRQDGWCLTLVPLGLLCEHEEERGTTTRFGSRALILWGPWLPSSGPQGAAFGVVSNEVTRVRFEFLDGTTATARIYLPPDDLKTTFKLFAYTRTNMPPGRALALDAAGRVLGRQAFG